MHACLYAWDAFEGTHDDGETPRVCTRGCRLCESPFDPPSTTAPNRASFNVHCLAQVLETEAKPKRPWLPLALLAYDAAFTAVYVLLPQVRKG